MGEHRVLGVRGERGDGGGSLGFGLRGGHEVGLGEDAINVVDGFVEAQVEVLAGVGYADPEIGADAAGILSQHHHAVGQGDGFFDVVGDEEDGAGGHFLAEPQFHQLAAQVFGGEHVERGERLVHEEDFGLHDQGAGKPDALFHAAGEFLGEGGFEAVEAHRIQDFQAAPHALVGGNAARLERGLHVIQHGEPGKQGEALKHDGDVGARAGEGLAVPENLAGTGTRKTGKNAQEGGFARAGRPQQGEDLAGIDGQVGGRHHLDARLGGAVEFLHGAEFEDRFSHLRQPT